MSRSIWPFTSGACSAASSAGFKLQQREIDAALRELARLIVRFARAGERVFVPGLGTFRPFERKARTMRSLLTRRVVQVPAFSP